MIGTYDSYGTLRYSPKLLGDRASVKWWAVLDCDQAVGKYYRELYWLTNYKCHALQRPAWKEHITVIRDEEPPEERKGLWERHSCEIIKFQIVPGVQNNGEYYWVNVIAPRLVEIRQELGLTPLPVYDFHLSVGHTKIDYTTGAVVV